MPRPDLTPINLGSIARGAALELFDKCLLQVTQNIADTDTNAEATRAITVSFKFKPESDRRTIRLVTSAKTTLAGAEDHVSKAYIGKSTDGQVLLFNEDPRQDVLFETPKQAENLIDFKTAESS